MSEEILRKLKAHDQIAFIYFLALMLWIFVGITVVILLVK